MELQRRKACRRARAGDPQAVAANTGLACRERRRRTLVPDQRLPDLRQQIQARPILHPRRGAALLADRRRHPHRRRRRRHRRPPALCASANRSPSTPPGACWPCSTPIRSSACCRRTASTREEVPLGQSFAPHHLDGSASGLEVELISTFPARSRCTSKRVAMTDLAGQPGDTVGVEVRADGRRLIYIRAARA